MNDLTIGKRVGLGIALILLLVIVLSVSFESTLSTTLNNFRGLVNNENAMIVRGNLAKVALLECRRNEKELLYADDELVIRKVNDFAARLRSELAAVNELARKTNDTKLDELTSRLLKPAEDYQRQFQAMVATPVGQERLIATIPMRKSAQALEGQLNELLTSLDQRVVKISDDTFEHASAASKFSLGLSVMVLSICVVLMYFLPRSIALPLQGTLLVADAIACGRLDNVIDSKAGAKSEVGRLFRSMHTMQGKLSEVVGRVGGLVHSLSQKAESVASASTQLGAALRQQAELTAQSAAAIEELMVSITEVSEIAGHTEANSNQTVLLAEEGGVLIGEIAQEIEAVAVTVSESSEQIKALEQRSQDIGGIANVIKEIADQTNLLALNAAIEAARAGEQGRGFAVVADEVRKLAERTGQATSEIGEKISAIQSETQSVVGAMQQAVPQVQKGLALTTLATAKLDDINLQASDSLQKVRDVANATRQQSTAVADVGKNVEYIAAMAEQSNAAMTQNAESAQELEEMSEELRQAIDYFRV